MALFGQRRNQLLVAIARKYVFDIKMRERVAQDAGIGDAVVQKLLNVGRHNCRHL